MSFLKISGLFIFFNCTALFLVYPKPDVFANNRFILSSPSISYKIIPSLDNTWGYDIYLDGKLAIHQPSIPALSGNKGFATQEQAATVAKLVVQKIKQGMMPPTITQEELKKLKAI